MRWMRRCAWAASLSLLAISHVGLTQVAVVLDAAAPAQPVEAIHPHATSLPRLTPVSIEILDAVGSKTSKSLDTFRIALAEPLSIDGSVIVPAGTTGQGEVVHAKKAGGMGAAGELVIAARYLDFAGHRLLLRSTRFDGAGKSRVDGVDALAAASAASPIPVAVIGFFIKGGEIELPAGTRVIARLAEDFVPASGTETAPEAPDTAAAAPDENGGKNQ